MSDHRPEPRLTTNLIVRVWGMGGDGKPFFQNVQAANISNHGARLSGIDPALTAGDVIGIQYGAKKGRFKVIWVIDAGSLQKKQVGVQLLSGQECPWKDQLERSEPASRHTGENRRKYPRLKIQFALELRDERVNQPMRVSATDISGNGCYIETMMPLPFGTALKIEFYMEGEKVATDALVRAFDPSFGMGIEFTTLDSPTRERLQAVLEKIAAEQAASAQEAPENSDKGEAASKGS